MKKIELIMSMPVVVEIKDKKIDKKIFDEVFNYFRSVDKQFSTFKKASEVSKFNEGKITKKEFSPEMELIYKLCIKTKKDTNGFFDAFRKNYFDPLGLVKGYAIHEAAKLIKNKGYKNYYVEAGGDVEINGNDWKIGIKNPFNKSGIVKVICLKKGGVATSGNYERGLHIYNPKDEFTPADEIASITVIAKDVHDADRFATAAFAMGRVGIEFIERTEGLEGYMIDKNGVATMTTGFEQYVKPN